MLWCIIASVDNQLCPISTKHNKNNVRKTFKHQDSIKCTLHIVSYITPTDLPYRSTLQSFIEFWINENMHECLSFVYCNVNRSGHLQKLGINGENNSPL